MQAVKDKLQDMNDMRKAKAAAKEEEKAEKDLAKARMEVAHEVRLAKEAEAAMELHVARAGEKAEREEAKHAPKNPNASGAVDSTEKGAMAFGPSCKRPPRTSG
ncbi:late embryogenesis abundant protein 6-like [Carya illinoinensis]|uniref:Late embryogenesis abundant protein n=1 Tax=Carya illinoinensis TaxID=32201 RepID=A0A8T1NH43_CARIL|nr:late embryogenesis abundant protein 6-like [Carya illinoinensis]KAG6628424.1 hypothetical protein CIPAW_14G012000 [Carya illinoinensis]